MKSNKLFVLAIIPMILFGCNKAEDKKIPENTEEKGIVKLELPATLNSKKSYYDLSFKYDNAFFSHSASIFDDNLKLLSFASACVTGSANECKDFFETMFFDNVQSYGYEEVTKDTIGYTFAHKDIEDYQLIAINVRGINYGKEWINNFTIGESGNHYGFSIRADEIYSSLNEYVSSLEEKPIKLWITGYSRGGGVANALADKLMSLHPFNLNEDNLFVYTYEAPGAIASENKVAYANVFNIKNSGDLIPSIPPAEYELVRCGIDVEIYNDNYRNWTKKFDKGIVLPLFTSSDKYKSIGEFISHFTSVLIEDYQGVSEEAKKAFVGTREEYYQNIQSDLCTILDFALDLSYSELSNIISGLKDSITSIFADIFINQNYEALYDKLDEVLTNLGIEFEEETLKPSVVQLTRFLGGRITLLSEIIDLLQMSIKQSFINNVTLSAYMHFPEMAYVMISNQTLANKK